MSGTVPVLTGAPARYPTAREVLPDRPNTESTDDTDDTDEAGVEADA